MTPDFSLYLIADPSVVPGCDLATIVDQAIQGGVTCVQYRDKLSSDADFVRSAVEVQEVCRRHRIPFIVNDRVGIAKAMRTDGVHLGRSDMSPAEARRILGSGTIVGGSAHTLEEALIAEKSGCDYLGCGSVFPTATKKDIQGVLGVEGLRKIVQGVTVPVVAIGGVTTSNAADLRSTGIAGIAVISAILLSSDPDRIAGELKALVSLFA